MSISDIEGIVQSVKKSVHSVPGGYGFWKEAVFESVCESVCHPLSPF